MAHPTLTSAEVSALGKKIYQEKIRSRMTESDIGKYVIVDVDSGDYEIDERAVAASARLRERKPDAFGYGLRVGYSAAYFFGWDEEPKL